MYGYSYNPKNTIELVNLSIIMSKYDIGDYDYTVDYGWMIEKGKNRIKIINVYHTKTNGKLVKLLNELIEFLHCKDIDIATIGYDKDKRKDFYMFVIQY